MYNPYSYAQFIMKWWVNCRHIKRAGKAKDGFCQCDICLRIKRRLLLTTITQLERDSWGLGLSAVRTIGIPDAGLLMFSSTSPVDAGRTHSRWLFTVTENLVDLVGEDFIEGMEQGVMQDMRIWSNKIHRPTPVLCEADKLLADFREWTKQFYSTNGHAK